MRRADKLVYMYCVIKIIFYYIFNELQRFSVSKKWPSRERKTKEAR